ncbi:hypothetical protein diail_7281 [Diaporthe ilicicola]|nr:hypothetical protein diail_7281 [Diaporthe ilicicola]
MQFTTLFSFATSLALASATVVQNREFEGDVAVLEVFDYNTTNCARNEPTVTIGVGPLALNQCIPFSQGYSTVSYSYLESEYSITFYTTDNCTWVIDQGNDFVTPNGPDTCETSVYENPWQSYKVLSSGHSKN